MVFRTDDVGFEHVELAVGFLSNAKPVLNASFSFLG
jgi:hypothetical protein